MPDNLKTVLQEWEPINESGTAPEMAPLDRPRNGGDSWAQSLLNEIADRIAALEAENARLLDIAQKEPHTAYLEAVQRACDERLVYLKHAERAAQARAELAERQRADARAALSDLVETLVCRVDIQPLLGFHEHAQISRARAALQDRAHAAIKPDSKKEDDDTQIPNR